MTTGSLCFTEIFRSRKPCSSNSEHSHSADSTSASGVALPYLASSRLSRDPALTPIRMGVPAALAALAISPTLSSNFLRSEEHTSELQSRQYLVCRLLLEKKKKKRMHKMPVECREAGNVE